ncbi:hypothetical protein LLG46_11480 [bacterium]|nr:hypothetical protein [bacterium]
MKLRNLSAIVLLAVCISSPLAAAGKLTVDPNQTRSAVSEPTPTSEDVTQKVTYEARKKTVSSILADLSEITGVKLYAGYNNIDWQVRDRRMNIFANDIPLANLMNSIARVMKFKWSKSENNGVVSYRLYMDRKTLLGADRQRYIEEERLNKIEAEGRVKVLDGLTAASTMSDRDLEQLKNTDPQLYMQCKMGYQNLLPALFEQNPAAKQAWLSGDMLRLGSSDLSDEIRQSILNVLMARNTVVKELTGKGSDRPVSDSDSIDNTGIYINYAKEVTGYRGDSYIGDVYLHCIGKDGAYGMFKSPDNEYANANARRQIRMLDGMAVDPNQVEPKDVSKTDFGEPLIEHEDDPALDAMVKLDMDGSTFVDLLAALAKASGYTIVSDSFWSYSKYQYGKDVDKRLKDILYVIEHSRHNWQRQGSIIEFRDRDWFRKRASQIPEAWLEAWRKSLKDTGTLDIDQLGQISVLSHDQFSQNILIDEVLGNTHLPLSWIFFKSSDFIKAYICLSDAQKTVLYSENGLDLSGVMPAQYEIISRIFRGKASSVEDFGSDIRLQCKRESQGKMFKYTFTATAGKDQPSVKHVFLTPEYKPPVKKELTDEKPNAGQSQQSKQDSNESGVTQK